MSQPFTLVPFPGLPAPRKVELSATVARAAHRLTLRYALNDAAAQIDLPANAELPARRDNLWQTTCLEFFVAPRDAASYWEFNLSPSGDWNVYRFEAYRAGMREEKAFSGLPFHTHRQNELFTLEVEIDLAKIIPANQKIQLGITAVIRLKTGDVSYWAIAHCGATPDFHLRESFVATT